MKSKWIEIPLGEYAKITMGQSPKSEYYNENKEGTPFLQGNKTFGTIYPTFEKYTTKITKLAKKNEILFSVRAPVGEINIAPEQLCIGRGLAALSSSNNLFLYYLLKYNQNRYEGFSSGTVFSSINKNTLNKILVNIPDLETQKKITSVLWSLDSKIELNNQMIDTLEEMASTLFKRWFVDFEFPDENGNPYKSSGGKMVESELGEIPEGWEVTEIGNLMENFDRKRVPLSKLEREKRKGNFPYYGAASLMDFVDGYIFDGTYLLLGEDGTVATDKGFPILQYVTGKFWVNNHAHVLKGKENLGITTEWLKLWFSQTNVKSIITGAVQPKISQKNLNNLKVSKASYQILSEFDSCISTMYVQIINITKENNSLIELRDTLLPKLLSGELEV